ncbi:hypothetical protein O0L34_g10235 [Tuta absoluta]|nr:hypothetical protein O0L34_g10235 [Tuta absoluta]
MLLAAKHNQFIKYPHTTAGKTAIRQGFTSLGQYNRHPGLRKIDGAIDCTHVRIVDTPGVTHHEAFRNRKSYFSINVQAVVGPFGEFLDVVARWAGSTHDSRIFQMSSIRMKYVQRTYDGILVGDRGYPCLQFLLTPVSSPTSVAEEVYNKVQSRTRNIVERSFGMWKRRFPCLRRGLGNKLSTVSNIIMACAVLFNIGLQANDDTPTEHEGIEEEEVIEPQEFDEDAAFEGSPDGFAVRQAIIANY